MILIFFGGGELAQGSQTFVSTEAVKLAFHDTDTDTDSPDTSIHPYVRYAQFPREDPREDVSVGVGVGVVECQLYATALTTD